METEENMTHDKTAKEFDFVLWCFAFPENICHNNVYFPYTIRKKRFQEIKLVEDVLKLIEVKGLGINICREPVTNLRVADDIVVLADLLTDSRTMLGDLNSAPKRVGPKMNKSKIKILSNMHLKPVPVLPDGENVYLG